MKYGLLIQLFLFFHISLSLNATTAQVYDIKKANDLYVATSYAQAIEVYEEISKQGYESATLYYNLGNAYYRINKIAPAILNYERALRLDPSNLDIQHNLKLAKAKTVDKMKATLISAEKNYEVARLRYQEGLSPFIEVSNAQLILTKAEVDNVQALYDYYLSRASLVKTTGLLPEDGNLDDIKLINTTYREEEADRSLTGTTVELENKK